jgi:hypothetical protein
VEAPIEAIYAVALLLERISDSAALRGDASSAFDLYREAFGLLWQARERHDTPETAHRLMILFAKVGDAWRASDDLESALGGYNSAHDTAERLDDHLQSPESRRDLAAAHGRLSDLQRQRNAPSEALEHAAAALAIDRELSDRLDTPEQQRALATALDRHALAEQQRGRHAEALAQQREAVAILRKVVVDSATPEANHALGTALTHLGNSEAALGDDEAARFHYQEAEALLRAEAGRFDAWLEHLDSLQMPHLLPVRRDLMQTLWYLGRLLRRQGDGAAALAPLREAAAIAEGGEEVLTSASSARTLAALLRDLSELHAELGNAEAERDALTRGLAAAKAATERRPDPDSEELTSWFTEHAAPVRSRPPPDPDG